MRDLERRLEIIMTTTFCAPLRLRGLHSPLTGLGERSHLYSNLIYLDAFPPKTARVCMI